jgi:hypothetical protein
MEQAGQAEKYPDPQSELHKGRQSMEKEQEFLGCLHII